MFHRKTGFLFFAIILIAAPAFAQVGIFEGQADWDLDDGTKVAGSITESNGVYTLQGNGNDIWGTNDEGFYAYTSKPSSESWQLSGKVVWIEPDISEWAKLGPMVRVDAQDPGSPNAFLLNKGMQDSMRAAHRPSYGADTNDSGWAVLDESGAQYSGNEIWMRMGYYAPLNMVYGEVSWDGQTWNHVITTAFDFGDNVNYGFAITNHEGNDVLAIGDVSEVVFEEVTAAPAFLGSGAGEFDHNVDVGIFTLPGEASYDASSDTYTITGSGSDIWDNNDGFHFLFKEMTGSFEAEAEMYITAPGNGEWTKGGIMVRADLGSAAPNAFLMQQTDGDHQLQYRNNAGDNEGDNGLTVYGDTNSRYRIVKVGGLVQAYYEDTSGNWVLDSEATIDVGETFLFGLGITAHDNNVLGSMEFTGLQITEYPFEVIRTASANDYAPGQTVDITLQVKVREGASVSSVSISEAVPPEAVAISGITGDGTLSGNVISWNVSGSTTLSYSVTAPSDINVVSMNWGESTSSGAGFDLPVGGPTQLSAVTFNAYESFSYIDGNGENGREGESIDGLNGGYGWPAGWTARGAAANGTLNLELVDAGLVQSQPQEYNPGNFSVELNGDNGDGFARELPINVKGGELWVSYTYREEGPAADHWSGVTFYNASGGEVSFIGKPFNAEFIGIGNLPDGDVVTDVPYNQNNHILARIAINGGASTVSVWVNPDKQDRVDTADATGVDDISDIAAIAIRRGDGGGSSALYDTMWFSSVPALPPAGAGRVDLQIDNPDRDPALPAWDVMSVDQVDDALVGVSGFGHDNGEDHYLIVSGFIYFTDVNDPASQVVAFGLPGDRMSGLNGHILGAFNNAIDETGVKNAMKFEDNDQQRGPFTFQLDPPGNYSELRSAQTVANGDGQLFATLNYEDGTTDDALLNSDDWYNDDSEISFDGIRQLVDGMNRLQGGASTFDDRFDPAVFEKTIAVNPDKVLVSVTLEFDPSVASSSFNLFDIWALPAGGTAVQDWALY